MPAADRVLLSVRATAEVPGGAAERILAPAELRRAARFAEASARTDWMAARVILRELLGSLLGLAPRAVPIAVDRRGKPYVEGVPDLQFSLSRSTVAVAVAVARARPVGVDIERVRPVAHAERIAALRLARADEAAVRACRGAARDHAFARGWASMEAMTKAWGQGMAAAGEYRAAADCARPMLDWGGRGWSVAVVAGPPGYVLAVAGEDELELARAL